MWSKKFLRVVVTFCLGFLLSCIVAYADDAPFSPISGSAVFNAGLETHDHDTTIDFPFSLGEINTAVAGSYDSSLTTYERYYNLVYSTSGLAFINIYFDSPVSSAFSADISLWSQYGDLISSNFTLIFYSRNSSLSSSDYSLTKSYSNSNLHFDFVPKTGVTCDSLIIQVSIPSSFSYKNLIFKSCHFYTVPNNVSYRAVTDASSLFSINMTYLQYSYLSDYISRIDDLTFPLLDRGNLYDMDFYGLSLAPDGTVLAFKSDVFEAVFSLYVPAEDKWYKIVIADPPNFTLEDGSQDAQDLIHQQDTYEQSFQNSMSENFEALGVASFQMDSDVTSGLQLVGSVFTSTWNSFGKWAVMFSFPLLFGVVLLLIGRVSRYDVHEYRREQIRQARSKKKG